MSIVKYLCSQLTQSVEFSEECGRLEVDEREHDEDEEERHGGELAPDLLKLTVSGVAHPLLLVVGEIVSQAQAHGVSNIYEVRSISQCLCRKWFINLPNVFGVSFLGQ